MAMRLITPAAAYPVSLDEARSHLRRDDEDDDSLITALIIAATSHLDGYSGILGRALLTQTWRLDLDRFPCGPIKLPLPPLQTVEAITYYDEGDQARSLDIDTCIIHAGPHGMVELEPGLVWPTISDRRNAVTVTFVAGYGDPPEGQDVSPVPAAIRHAMLLLIGHWYENREAVNIGNIVSELPLAVNSLLAPYRIVTF